MRLIDADALKEQFREGAYTVKGIREEIDNAPTVAVGYLTNCANCERVGKIRSKRPQGEWIKGREISRTMIGDMVQHIDYKDYTCSNCGLVLDNLLYHCDGSPFYKFCPNCGAYMRGER